MRRQLIACAFALTLAAGCKGSSSSGKVNLQTDEDKTIYAAGWIEGQRVAPFDLTESEWKVFMAGLMDARQGKEAQVDASTFSPRIHKLLRERQEKRTKLEKEKSKAFLDKVAGEPGVEKLPSGVLLKTETPGTGASPSPEDMIKVNYRGTLANGKEFDSNKGKAPVTFNLRNNIRCWVEALPKMKVGGKATLYCPPELAYGDFGRPKIPGGSALVFEVELLDTQKPAPPPAPAPGTPAAPMPGAVGPGHPAAGPAQPAAPAKPAAPGKPAAPTKP